MQLLPRLLLAGGIAFALAFPACAGDTAMPPSQLIPDRAAVSLEILRPGPVWDALLSPEFESRLKALPAYEGLVSGPKLRDLRTAIGLVETTLHTNWHTILRTVSGQNACLALGAGKRHLFVLTGNDPATFRGLHDFALQIARSEADKRGQPDQVRSVEYAGVTGWTFNGKEAHTLIGNQLLAASDAAVLKAAVELRNAGGVGSLASREDYKAARKAVGTDAVAMLFLDLEQLRDAPWFKTVLQGQQKNPLTSLLFADLPEIFMSARWLALGAYTTPRGLSLRAFSDAAAQGGGAAAFARVKEGTKGLAPTLEVPRQLSVLNLHRDLVGFYAAKDTLFPERTSGLIFFENMMGIFFSGRNLTDEVLAETEPQIQLVVARQEYDPSIGVPDPQLPAFALVFGLRHPDQSAEIVEEAWQKALGLVNFTRGQKAQPGLILDRVEYKGNRITLAKFSANEIDDRSRVDQRFNFRPSLAFAKGHAILSSTDQLARDLLDALAKRSADSQPVATQTHTVLQISGPELAGMLRANRMSLVRGNMVKEGKSREEAEAGIDNFIAMMGWVNQATLTAGNLGGGQIAELRLRFSKP